MKRDGDCRLSKATEFTQRCQCTWQVSDEGWGSRESAGPPRTVKWFMITWTSVGFRDESTCGIWFQPQHLDDSNEGAVAIITEGVSRIGACKC